MGSDGLLLLACLCREACASIVSLCAARRRPERGSRSRTPLRGSPFIAFTFIIHFINYRTYFY
jgi:hypothetical protein